MVVIGLISGTSTDGIDAALVEIEGRGDQSHLKLVRFDVYPYPAGLRRRLLRVCMTGSVSEICHLNFYLGELFARAAKQIARRAGLDLSQVDLIGSHGQTIHHLPTPKREGGFPIRSTLQIGEPSVIAERTGVTTVADFRPRDIAAGGEGAPLTPLLHHLLFSSPSRSGLVINIGGISNMTHLPAGGSTERLLAFDCGPGNMLIDGLVEFKTKGKFLMDRDGRLARQGRVIEPLLARLMGHPFLRRRPPKTTGREAFGRPLMDQILKWAKPRPSMTDLVATVTAFTADCLISHFDRFIAPRGGASEVIVGGGGVRNPVLMDRLKRGLKSSRVVSFEHHGFDSKAIEAMAFALFAAKTIVGEPSNLPTATGAKGRVVMGKIVPGGTRLILRFDKP